MTESNKPLFRVGGCYMQVNGLVARVASERENYFLVESVFRPEGSDIFSGGGGRWKDDGRYIHESSARDRGLRLLPGELELKDGQWVPVPASDGWIEWKGGECPVAPDALVQLRYRDGEEDLELLPASQWHWDHHGDGDDVLAYRVAEPAKAEATKDVDGNDAEVEAMHAAMEAGCNAAMIERDGPPKHKPAPVAAEPVSTAKPALASLGITRDLGHQLPPNFGSASL